MNVYAIRLNFSERFDPILYERLSNHVTPEKKARLKRFVREEDRLRGLFADLLIRDAIRQRIGLSNEEILFDSNYYGKPFLTGREDVRFNLSHSGVWVVGCIDDRAVGIDVEEIQPIDLDISENYFSKDEHQDLMAKPDKFDYFFTLWSLKESYIKILGKGLSHPLNTFSMKFLSPREIIMNVEGKRVDDIFFKQYDIDSKYKMAVCASHDRFPDNVEIVTTTHLIEKFFPSFAA
jgi:4'-phosphopantetheinyl transferase